MSLDFKAIAALPITDLAARLGFKLEQKGEQLVGTCPISQTGNATCFKITPSMNRWICFCAECKKLPKQGGDSIELMRRLRRCDPREAAAQVERMFNGAAQTATNGSATSAEPEAPARKDGSFDPLVYLKSLDAEHEALAALDILPETLIEFKAGYSSKGLLRGRLAIAWHDQGGVIRAFIGVALDSSVPRYLLPKGMQTPYFFGIDRLEEGEELRILPHVFDVLRAFENGATNCIAPLRPCDPDALTCLQALCTHKKLTIEF